jgi:hypothetical protein
MLFVHRVARDRRPPGAWLLSKRAPYVKHRYLPKGTFAWTLRPGVFEASVLVIERIWTEATEQARQAPPAGPPAEPSPPVGSDGPTGRPEAPDARPGPPPSETAVPSDPTEGDRNGTPADPAAVPPVDRHAGESTAAGEERRTAVSLADQIQRRWPRKKKQAELVKYMSDRDSASYADVASSVYGDDLTDGGAIEQLVLRTNETLVELGASFHLRFGAEHVFKDPV